MGLGTPVGLRISPTCWRPLLCLLVTASWSVFRPIPGTPRPTFFSDTESVEKARLLFFTAKGCAPCKKAGPLLLKLAKKWERQLRLVVVDFDESPLIVEDFSVVELPTIIFLDSDENLVIRVDGASKVGIEVLLVKDGASISYSSELLI